MRRYLAITACLLSICLITTAAGATSLIKLDKTEMTTQADAIVIGRCDSATSQWVGGTLMTMITVEVSDSLKGVPGEELTLVVPGGIDTDREIPVAVTFPGAPTFFADEQVLLFLSNSSTLAGGFDVMGFNQGKFTLVEDASGSLMVHQGGTSMPLAAMTSQINKVLATR